MSLQSLKIRPAEDHDVGPCGVIMYEAFKDVAESRNFPPDFPDAETAAGLLGMMQQAPHFDGFVAEGDGQRVGSIFVSRRSPVGGISVLTVAPEAQDRSVGRSLMRHAMTHLADGGHTRQQLVQAAYHNRSLCLYTKLGFAATEMLSNLTYAPIRAEVPDRAVRAATPEDAATCNALCRQVHGFDRAGEVAAAIDQGTAFVVEDADRITGYTTGVGFIGHAVGSDNQDLKALLASAEEFSGPGVLIPTANAELLQWCFENGLQLRQEFALMDTAPSSPPNGVYWPAILC